MSALIILSSSGFGELYLGFEFQRQGINAVPFSGRLRPIIKDVAEVGVTPTAHHFHPPHAQGHIILRFYIRTRGRIPETGPARAAIELGIGLEEFLPAIYTDVHARSIIVQEFARTWWLGPFVEADVVLFVC